jgi:hypothetical protein
MDWPLSQPLGHDKVLTEPDGAEPDEELTRVIVPGKGTFFNQRLDLRDLEGTTFLTQVLELCDAVKPVQRYRADHATRVRKLIANALRGYWYRQSPAILYFRKADAPDYADKPRWMRHGALGNAVDTLAKAGLVQGIVVGKRMPWYSRKRSWASSYAATDQLVALALECGLSAKSIELRLQLGELVRLFERKLRHERKGKPVAFDPTVETRQWTAAIEAINVFYREQDIALEASADDLAAWNAKPDRRGAPYRLPEMFLTDLYRVFNDGLPADPRFDAGGRLNGGWWMNLLKELRPAITINGQPTVELDYSECHPRMLYHERGLDGPEHHYELPEIAAYETANGLKPGTYRPCIKHSMQVLINSKGRPNKAELPDDLVFPPGYPLDEILRLLEIKHQPIADTFKTGAGMRLMRIESDMALKIVSTAANEGWTALPIHDSFIAPEDRRDRLMALMTDVYVARFGKEPTLKQEGACG